MRTLLALMSLIALLAGAQGCVAIAAAGAGVGGYAYVSGDLEKNLEAPLDQVYDAALAVMEDMQYAVTSNAIDALEARINAEQADETAVKIRLEAKGDSLTHTSVRIGLFGDEAQSAYIMEQIEARLP